MSAAYVRYNVIISGDVQGVGFRSWLKRTATKLHITGWVKNREDGTVEADIQGEEHAIEEVLNTISEGPITGRVDAVERRSRPPDQTTYSFDVVY